MVSEIFSPLIQAEAKEKVTDDFGTQAQLEES